MTRKRSVRWRNRLLWLGILILALAAGIFLGNLLENRQYWSKNRLEDFSVNVERYAASLPQTTSQQEQLDTLTLLMLRGENARYREIPYLAQYLVNEYAKQTAGAQARALSHHSVVRLFGLKWLTGWHKTII